MADKQISDLTSASALTDGSLFVIEQSGAAKSANWGMMKNYIAPNVAPQYSASSTYGIGDYVVYNNQLYRCRVEISTAEAWTSSHWTATVLSNEVTGVYNEDYIINALGSDGEYTYSATDFEIGSWGYSVKVASTKRLRSKWIVPIQAGVTVRYSNPTLKMYIGVVATRGASAYVQNSGWISAGGSGWYNITNDGYLIIILEGGEGIVPSDYDCTIKLFSPLYNSVDAVQLNRSNATHNGVTYSWDWASCNISGTASSVSVNNIYYNETELPKGISAGGKMYFDVDLPTNVRVEVLPYINGTAGGTTYIYYSQAYDVPANASGMLIRFFVPAGVIISGVAKIGIYPYMPNSLLSEFAGSGIYYDAKTVSRVNNINRSVSAGETVLFWPVGWTGPTASKLTLYGISNGASSVLGETTIGKALMKTVPDSYDSLRIGITCDDISGVATLSMYLAIGNADGIGDQMFSILSEMYSSDEIYITYNTISRVFAAGVPVSAGDTIFFKPVSWGGPSAEYYSLYVYEGGSRVQIPGARFYNLGESFIYTFDQSYDDIYIGINCDPITDRSEFAAIFVKTGYDGTNSQMFTVVNDLFQASGGGNWVSPLRNKYLSILGASSSTFQGYIPEGYSAYYPHEGASGGDAVTNVNDTYWKKVIDALGMQLLVNNSSSGSFCTTGHGSDSMAGCGTRCETLDDGVHNPDIILVQMGLNDFTRSTPIGTYDGTQSTFPTDTSYFRNAYAVMLKKICTKYKHARVFCMTLNMVSGGTYISQTFPPKNGDGILIEAYNQAVRDIASLFGCHVIELNRCGITYQNIDLFDQDYSSASNYGMHANKNGHSLYANEVIRTLDPSCPNMYSY